MIQSFEFPDRREVAAAVTPMLRTGDILIRMSKTKGPLGIPFSGLVSDLTQSDWSHSALVFMVDGKAWVLEVSDAGVTQMRFVDWLPYCVGHKFLVLRHKDMTPAVEAAIQVEIDKYLELDQMYDFTYSNPSRVYCVGSVCDIYGRVGIQLMEPMTVKEAIGDRPVVYGGFVVGNGLMKKISGKGFDLKARMYFVGNDKRGILACPKIGLVYSHGG